MLVCMLAALVNTCFGKDVAESGRGRASYILEYRLMRFAICLLINYIEVNFIDGEFDQLKHKKLVSYDRNGRGILACNSACHRQRNLRR